MLLTEHCIYKLIMEKNNFKYINIGELIKTLVYERDIEMNRLCKNFNCDEKQINIYYESESLDSKLLLKWSKILEYDLFRLYSQHLILYAPSTKSKLATTKKSNVPQFRKNIYTFEIIEYVINLINNKTKTIEDVITEYNIPKTTLYKWLKKHS